MKRFLLLVLTVALLVLCGCGSEKTENRWVLQKEGVYTLSDGETVDLWRKETVFKSGTPMDCGADFYRLSGDGTLLLWVDDPVGPENVYVAGVDSLDDLPDVAQEKVCSFYDNQGQLYDPLGYLDDAYDVYLILKHSGEDYGGAHISQEVVPTAYNERLIWFMTVLTLPTGNGTVTETRLTAVFDRETGENIPVEDLFVVSGEELADYFIGIYDNYDEIKDEMQAAFRPEYIQFSAGGWEVMFPKGTLPSQQTATGMGGEIDQIREILKDWAVPEGEE